MGHTFNLKYVINTYVKVNTFVIVVVGFNSRRKIELVSVKSNNKKDDKNQKRVIVKITIN